MADTLPVDLYAELKTRLQERIDEWHQINGDSVLGAKEVGMLMIHAGQDLAWLMGFRSDTAALRNAAERLFDEVLQPSADALIAGGLTRLPWYLKPLGWILPGITSAYKAKVRAWYVDLVQGALEALNNVLVSEREDAARVALQETSGGAGKIEDPSFLGRRGRRERRISAAAVRGGKAT